MRYLCIHGYVFMSCDICSEETDVLRTIESDLEEFQEQFDEYMYDYYLDRDEQFLREMEEK